MGRDAESNDSPAVLLVRSRGLGEIAESEDLRGAEHVADTADPQAAPAAPGEERDDIVGRLGVGRPRRRHRLQRRVLRVGGGGESSEGSTELLLGHSGRREERHDTQPRLGEGARLVDAERVHGGERLDCVQLLRESTGTGHSHGRRRVGDREEEYEPFGNQGHHSGDSRLDRVIDGDVLLPQRDDQHRSERHHDSEKHVEQPVDRPLERRARMAELTRRSRDALGVAVGSDGGHFERSGSLDHERAGSDLVAVPSVDSLRLAGQDRLVEAKIGAGQEPAVGDDLVSRREEHEVSDDDLRDVERPRRPVTHDRRPGRDERSKLIELPSAREAPARSRSRYS